MSEEAVVHFGCQKCGALHSPSFGCFDPLNELRERIDKRIELRWRSGELRKRCGEDTLPEQMAEAELRWVSEQIDKLFRERPGK